MFPKVIRAGAGPHDLGPGDNAGGAFPELAVQPDVEPTDDTDLELDVVIRNTPDVCFLPHPFLRSKFCLQDKEFDDWHPVADYVFQVIPFPMSLPRTLNLLDGRTPMLRPYCCTIRIWQEFVR